MQLNKKIILALIMSSISVPTAGFACTPVPCGCYLEGNVGGSHVSNINIDPAASFNSNGTGWNINAGWKFNPWVAAEIGYTQYDNAKVTTTLGGFNLGSVKQFSYDIAGKGIWPIMNSGFELFAKLGWGQTSSNFSINNSSAAAIAAAIDFSPTNRHSSCVFFGGGVDYFFTPNIAINAQWERANGNSSTGRMDLYSVGVTFLTGGLSLT